MELARRPFRPACGNSSPDTGRRRGRQQRRPRQPSVGCARRSPDKKPEDAGSIPATSTRACSQMRARCVRNLRHRDLGGAARGVRAGKKRRRAPARRARRPAQGPQGASAPSSGRAHAAPWGRLRTAEAFRRRSLRGARGPKGGRGRRSAWRVPCAAPGSSSRVEGRQGVSPAACGGRAATRGCGSGCTRRW
jgi:hypothetical protein